jgi:hypothetical protein
MTAKIAVRNHANQIAPRDHPSNAEAFACHLKNDFEHRRIYAATKGSLSAACMMSSTGFSLPPNRSAWMK